MVMRENEFNFSPTVRRGRHVPQSMRSGKVTPVPHYVIEVVVRQVIPADGEKDNRVVDEMTRIVTKSHDAREALLKGCKLLSVELEDYPEIVGDDGVRVEQAKFDPDDVLRQV